MTRDSSPLVWFEQYTVSLADGSRVECCWGGSLLDNPQEQNKTKHATVVLLTYSCKTTLCVKLSSCVVSADVLGCLVPRSAGDERSLAYCWVLMVHPPARLYPAPLCWI